jgi:osmotically-inducible protein OsmY
LKIRWRQFCLHLRNGKPFQISVETYKGTVQLGGLVGSQKALDKAGEIVRGVEGVKSIENDVIVK